MAQIIPKNPITVESNWQKELASAFTDPGKLLAYLDLDPILADTHGAARKLFPMRVPRPFARRMQKGELQDPLLRQVMPLLEEFSDKAGFSTDPLQEQAGTQPGILHKYQSRVLLIVRGGCAVNCRYCFRRHFPYDDNHVDRQGWQQALDYLRQDTKLNEVIYSGGDPLMAKDEFLAWLSTKLAAIPHLSRLRIHTRLPVVIPSRISPAMIKWFTRSRLRPVLVLHINHAQEIDTELADKLAELKRAGVTLLNQAVLLKGVNDNIDAQVRLSESLFAAGVLPYYLHMLDKVKGAGHFDVDEKAAKALMAELIKRQPGFLVPKLVREIAGQPGKTPIDLQLHP